MTKRITIALLVAASVMALSNPHALAQTQTTGCIAGTVTIHAAPPLMQTDGSQLGTRSYTQILALSPGAITYLPDNTATSAQSSRQEAASIPALAR
jgi:hypothetical protein